MIPGTSQPHHVPGIRAAHITGLDNLQPGRPINYSRTVK